MSLLEQDIIRKKQVHQLPKPKKFEVGDNKEYEIEAIINNVVYSKKTNGQMSDLYYLVL